MISTKNFREFKSLQEFEIIIEQKIKSIQRTSTIFIENLIGIINTCKRQWYFPLKIKPPTSFSW